MGDVVVKRGGRVACVVNHTGHFQGEEAHQPNGLYSTKNLQYNEAVREICRQRGDRAIDLQPLLEAAGMEPELFYKDLVHLSFEGNQLYGQVVFSAIQPLLEELL